MDFEQCLKVELGAIPGLDKKIFPLRSPKGTVAPYAIYLCAGGEAYKVYGGYSNVVKTAYEINIIASTYTALKSLENTTAEKLKSFHGREIGDGSITVQNISIDEPAEIYEPEVDLVRANYQITIIYGRN